MALRFSWDETKALANERKHGVSFFEAISVFGDPGALTLFDAQHSLEEDRFVELGISQYGRLLVVVYAERDGILRIISCRTATTGEQRQYEQRAS